MSGESGKSSGGIGFVGALQLLFIGLKLTGYIDWPWWAVMMPFLASIVLFVVVLALLVAANR